MDVVFRALSDPTRRRLLDRLHSKGGLTLGELCARLDMTRQAVTQHLAMLEAANLVSVEWSGREKRHYLNPVPLQEIYDRWVKKFQHSALDALANLKRQVEGEHGGARKIRVRNLHRRQA